MRVKASGSRLFDVVVVGNGPSGICLSYLLSGNWPYYNGEPVPDPLLNDRVEYCGTEVSLVEQDLEDLSDGLYDARSRNPVSILFDKLHHPNADFMTNEPSVLKWKSDEAISFKHLVLGNGPPGGTWHRMSYSQYSLSLDYWLELPGYPLKTWQDEHNYTNETSGCSCNLPKLTRGAGVHENRILPNHAAQYYSDYVKRMKLDGNFMNNVTVTSVKRVGPNNPIWAVCGNQYNSTTGELEPFQVFSRNVVLAVGGYSRPRKLNIPGEHLQFVSYHLPDLDDFMNETDGKIDPVVVVGCGLVALDAVIALIDRKIPVFHVFRREAKDAKLIVNQLPSSYPDYLKLKPLMTGRCLNEFYTPFQQSKVSEILPSGECLIEHVTGKSRVVVKTSQVVIQIGSKPNLSFLGEMQNALLEDSSREVDIKENPVAVNLSSYETGEPGLYAMGPLVGDNFVRFILGGALGVVSGLVQKIKEDKE